MIDVQVTQLKLLTHRKADRHTRESEQTRSVKPEICHRYFGLYWLCAQRLR